MSIISAGPNTAESRAGQSLPELDEPFAGMQENAKAAAGFLKALSHEGRLMILCHLAGGEKSVTQLEHLLHTRQAAVSQQLARLRQEGLVTSRREGKAIFYSLQDPKVQRTIAVIYDLFCNSACPD